MATFFQTWDSGSIRNGGTEVRDGKIFSQVKCRTSSALCVFVFKNVHLTAHFLPSHQETIEVESENVFKLAAFALQVRICVVVSLVWILSANVHEDKATFELLSFEAATYVSNQNWILMQCGQISGQSPQNINFVIMLQFIADCTLFISFSGVQRRLYQVRKKYTFNDSVTQSFAFLYFVAWTKSRAQCQHS